MLENQMVTNYVSQIKLLKLIVEIHQQHNHIGSNKTHHLFRESFYNRNVRKKIIQIIRKCSVCPIAVCKFKVVLVITDNFSKLVKLYPLNK